MANETREMVLSIAKHFGYSQDDAEDIAQEVMLRLWNLHEHISDVAHLKASAAITTKCVCVDKWRSARHRSVPATPCYAGIVSQGRGKVKGRITRIHFLRFFTQTVEMLRAW